MSGWREQALCAQVDPELWFPEKGGSAKAAKRICRQCPVQTQCLDYALRRPEQHGIWGGVNVAVLRRLHVVPDSGDVAA